MITGEHFKKFRELVGNLINSGQGDFTAAVFNSTCVLRHLHGLATVTLSGLCRVSKKVNTKSYVRHFTES